MLEDGGALELVRVPAWEMKFKRGENPDELAHLVCCRDLEWRKALCGFEETDPVILEEATTVCSMCVEAAGGPDGPIATGHCPIDNQLCPDSEDLSRKIAERTSGP